MSRTSSRRRSRAGRRHLHVPGRGRRPSGRAREISQHRWVMLALISGVVAGVTAATRAALGRTHDRAAAGDQAEGEDQTGSPEPVRAAPDPMAASADHHGNGAADMAREWEQGVAPSDS